MTFERYNNLVEGAISKLGLDAALTRTENEGQWNIAKDENVQIMIDLWEENGIWFFQALSPIGELGDENNASFLKLLLEENHGFCETAFTVFNNGVFLKMTSEAADMDENRILKSITRIAYYNELFQKKIG